MVARSAVAIMLTIQTSNSSVRIADLLSRNKRSFFFECNLQIVAPAKRPRAILRHIRVMDGWRYETLMRVGALCCNTMFDPVQDADRPAVSMTPCFVQVTDEFGNPRRVPCVHNGESGEGNGYFTVQVDELMVQLHDLDTEQMTVHKEDLYANK
jgi:hypothetical protein